MGAMTMAKANWSLLVMAATLAGVTPALAVDVVNRDTENHTIRVIESPSSTRYNVAPLSTQLSVCWSCKVQVDGLGEVDARPGQTVYITSTAAWAADPVRADQGYQPSVRERLGLGAPPLGGVDAAIPNLPGQGQGNQMPGGYQVPGGGH